MLRSTWSYLMVSLLAATLAASCGGGDDDTGDDGGGNVADADPSAPDAPPNIVIDATPSVDAPFVPGPDAAPGSCNFIANSAAEITLHRIVQSPPTPLGGTIVDGTYHLTADDFYVTDMPMDLGAAHGTILIMGTTMEQAHAQDLGEDVRTTSTFVVNGSDITFSQTCPTVNDLAWDFYTATPTSLTVQYQVTQPPNPLVVRVRVYTKL